MGGRAAIRCPGWDWDLVFLPPRGVASRGTVEEVAVAFGAQARSILDRAVSGVCPYCTGRISVESPAGRGTVPEGKVSFGSVCSDCRGRVTVSAVVESESGVVVVAVPAGGDELEHPTGPGR